MLARLNALFVKVTDFVSWAMGMPPNILFWFVAVGTWFLLFGLNPRLQNSTFLPSWFTSNAFNFPLNTVTTLAELFIGFLVAAATNRAERALMELLHNMYTLMGEVKALNENQTEILKAIVDTQAKQDAVLSLLQAEEAKEEAEVKKVLSLIEGR